MLLYICFHAYHSDNMNTMFMFSWIIHVFEFFSSFSSSSFLWKCEILELILLTIKLIEVFCMNVIFMSSQVIYNLPFQWNWSLGTEQDVWFQNNIIEEFDISFKCYFGLNTNLYSLLLNFSIANKVISSLFEITAAIIF